MNQVGIDLMCDHYGAKQHLSDREKDEHEVAQQDDHGYESAPDPRDPLQKQRSGASAAAPQAPP